jgi:hypothetical protein
MSVSMALHMMCAIEVKTPICYAESLSTRLLWLPVLTC